MGGYTFALGAHEAIGLSLMTHGCSSAMQHSHDLSFSGHDFSFGRASFNKIAKNTNPFEGPIDEDVYIGDASGNIIPVKEGNWLTGTQDGKWLQERETDGTKKGRETGVRKDGGHKPSPAHTDPRSLEPHGHIPGLTNPDGTPWLPIK